ncbi:MAG: alpha/beta hydrolase [Mesorhizobium sp.]|uniref:alpha/beta hydrolase n=1 Tax=unclassified Mesorhizobium TaxID=325217 RepID=UPI000FCAAF28|nr:MULTISPECIES: alpha/beta hydrolase [unclassified Mesorhizobium]RVD70734.1 alpha/beta hydrolase [Mesorhizobium sp. M4A.F.Ca.ET.029.04.2.1]RUX42408.1 alpha/beta hydrolase [Mesorhizobium sp. M4A.F.Ca.ET.050.02.1.1]RVC77839.1 alpha/beta hydrolase [Mesorhizobium sp. M4A.F.Ca.ET.022.05.2.1]RVD31897.1 alpha/beta hydrolase [Mesorhizobium sp. M4A.F.Ca.ET.020.02.1.1]RWC19377.1 MAG: alpha/beta hydrolase [Mesorhizobium sp.]
MANRFQVSRTLLTVIALLLSAVDAGALELKPYKDDLFAYPATLSSGDNGAYTVIDYREMRDINQRDEVPEKRVHGEYTDTGVRKLQQDLMLKTDAGDVRHVAVGKTEGAGIIVLYLHGQGGSRKQGVDDFTFGGNFNRLKNLMAANGGLYLSPDFPDFGDKGAAQVAALINHYAEKSPGAKIFVACGSMGGSLCWKLAARNDTGRRIDGLLLLGSLWDESFLASPAFRRHVPVFFGQGSKDPVFPVEKQEAFFRSIIAKSKAYPYPTRFVRFETGTHGTPIRMTDWRGTLNWMLSKAP